jgi:DeoR/GlpR family transcriptional regulator of sugar metabolism
LKKLPYARRQEILEILKQEDYVDLKRLSEQFDVSYMTIHRDIEELERNGEVDRVYGGVKIAAGQGNSPADEKEALSPLLRNTDLTIEERFKQQKDCKQAIAKRAASYVREGNIIGMDPSTTTLHMCSYIQHMNITVVTTSLMVALQLSSSPTVKIVMPGGRLRKRSMTLRPYNPQTSDLGLYLDMCFLSSKALSFPEGLTDLTAEEPESKRLLVRHSSQVFVLADHTKIGDVGHFRVLKPEEMTCIITDRRSVMRPHERSCLEAYAGAGVEVVFAAKLRETPKRKS